MMKNLKIALLAFAVMCTTNIFADGDDDLKNMNNTELSDYFKQKISETNASIKLVKIKQKADKDNVEIKKEMSELKVTLKDYKNKKKIIDKAIKTEKKAVKAKETAEKAKEAAEKAIKEAENAAKAAARISR